MIAREFQMCRGLWFFALIVSTACAGRASDGPRAPSIPAGRQVKVGSILHGDEPVRMTRPTLPSEAQARGVAGPVVVEIRIAETGDVSVLRVLRGHPLLDELAKTAVSQWKYRPVVIDGRAVPIIKVVAVPFVPSKDPIGVHERKPRARSGLTRAAPDGRPLTVSSRG
jgi:TonB family protein